MTCPTCQSNTRVIATRDGYRRRLCPNGHRSVTLEQTHDGKFPWRKPKPKPLKKKKKQNRSTKWLRRIEAKLAEA